MARIVVIGAGVGGITTAALLTRAGHAVTVLEAHISPGGSAATFFHKGYQFDAGATLAGGFSSGGPHARIAALLGLRWDIEPIDPAWVVHLPGRSIHQWRDPHQWQAERQAHFPGSEAFWRRQEQLAETAWQVSAGDFPFPPDSPVDLLRLARALNPAVLRAAPFALRTVASLLPADASPDLRAFLDAQLLISAQTTSRHANALYASAALDLPRRGVYHFKGGIGTLSTTLANWVKAQGGTVLYRQPVTGIVLRRGRPVAVQTGKGMEIACDAVIANLTPPALAALLGDRTPAGLRHSTRPDQPGWGAFVLYLGLNAARLPAGIADHHQVVVDSSQPLGEGNSIFLSLSNPNDPSRAPAGRRAATLSTHTAVEPWWRLHRSDPAAYARRKEEYTRRALAAAERAIPGIGTAVELCLPGTPLTFEFYTRRPLGLVGGVPQTSLFSARRPQTGIPNLWLVGDSIFPGQSTAGVTLGAMRVAADVRRSLET